MNVQKVVEELKKKYPVKKVIVTDPENPGEIICETKPGKEKSEAVAVIDYTRFHYHKVLTEVYEVTKGELTMNISGKKKVVKEGESITLLPGTRHSADGNETWIRVYSTPGWTPADHILLRDDGKISRKELEK